MQLWHPDTLLFDSSPQKYPSFSISGYTGYSGYEKLNLEAKCPHDNFSCLLLENKNSLLCKMSTPISRFPAVLFPSDIDFLSLHLWGEEGKRIMIFWKVILKKKTFYKCGLHLMFICLMFHEVWFWMKISSLYNIAGSPLSKMIHLIQVRLVLCCQQIFAS